MELLATFRDWIDDDSKRWKLYAVLSGLAMIRLWVIPLSCSLWLDETITYWSAYKGVGASLIRSQFWPGQNLAYSLLVATVIRLGGTSEIALRLPSVFAAIATTWLLYLLAKRMFDKETGFLAALVFVSSEQMTQTAPNARPYAIALLLVVASTLQLLRWLENERSLDMLGYVALAASVLYFHLLFGSLYLIHGIYVLASHASGSPARRRQPIIAALLLALLIAPIVWNTVFVKRPSTASSYQGTPDAARLLTAFLPATLGSSLFVALLVGLLFRQDHFSSVSRMPHATTVLLTSWLTIPIVVDFLVARFTGFKIFLPRYYLCSLPALSLLVAWGVRQLMLAPMRLWLSSCIVFGAIVSFGGFQLRYSPFEEDWRALTQSVRRSGITEETPVLFRGGMVEETAVHWDPTSNVLVNADNPLLCPLSKYPIPGRMLLSPHQLDRAGLTYMDEVTSKILEQSPQFVFITRHIGRHDQIKPWLIGYCSGKGFVATDLYDSESMTATIFRKSKTN